MRVWISIALVFVLISGCIDDSIKRQTQTTIKKNIETTTSVTVPISSNSSTQIISTSSTLVVQEKIKEEIIELRGLVSGVSGGSCWQMFITEAGQMNEKKLESIHDDLIKNKHLGTDYTDSKRREYQDLLKQISDETYCLFFSDPSQYFGHTFIKIRGRKIVSEESGDRQWINVTSVELDKENPYMADPLYCESDNEEECRSIIDSSSGVEKVKGCVNQYNAEFKGVTGMGFKPTCCCINKTCTLVDVWDCE